MSELRIRHFVIKKWKTFSTCDNLCLKGARSENVVSLLFEFTDRRCVCTNLCVMGVGHFITKCRIMRQMRCVSFYALLWVECAGEFFNASIWHQRSVNRMCEN